MPPKEPDTKHRTLGRALGSGVSSVITGYAAAPHLFADKGREFSMAALKANPKQHLKHIYGGSALKKGLILAGVSAAGGAISEAVQSAYERKNHAPKVGADFVEGFREQQLIDLGAGGASTQPPLTHLHPEKCRPIARQVLISAGIIGKQADDAERRRSNPWEPRPFRGDLDGLLRFGLRADQERWKTAGELARGLRSLNSWAESGLGKPRAHLTRIRREATRLAGKGRSPDRIAERMTNLVDKTNLIHSDGLHAFQNHAARAAHEGAARAKHADQGISLLLYRRHPGELGKEQPRKKMKGPAAILGHRLNPREVMRKGHRGEEDNWMREHAEVLDLGTKPGLAATLQDVCGLREGQVVSRAELLKLLQNKDDVRDESVTRRRFAKIKGKPELGADSRHDAGNFIKDLQVLLENPDVRYVELARK